MRPTKYARLVRVCDERNRGEPTSSVCERLERLIATGVHKSQKPYKRQHTDAPYRGQPVVAVGAHGHDDIAMFGAYAGLAWRPNPAADDTMFPTVIDVDWDPHLYAVDPAAVQRIVGPLPRSMKFISKAEFDALREIAVPR